MRSKLRVFLVVWGQSVTSLTVQQHSTIVHVMVIRKFSPFVSCWLISSNFPPSFSPSLSLFDGCLVSFFKAFTDVDHTSKMGGMEPLWAFCEGGGRWCSLEPLSDLKAKWMDSITSAPPNKTPQSSKRQQLLFIITWATFNRFPPLIFYFLPLILTVNRWMVDCDQRAVSSFFQGVLPHQTCRRSGSTGWNHPTSANKRPSSTSAELKQHFQDANLTISAASPSIVLSAETDIYWCWLVSWIVFQCFMTPEWWMWGTNTVY